MNERIQNILKLNELREKLGISPKKCIYEIEKGEIIIYNISERKRCLS